METAYDKVVTILNNRVDNMKQELQGKPLDFSNWEMMSRLHDLNVAENVVNAFELEFEDVQDDFKDYFEEMLKDKEFPETLDSIYNKSESYYLDGANYFYDEIQYHWNDESLGY